MSIYEQMMGMGANGNMVIHHPGNGVIDIDPGVPPIPEEPPMVDPYVGPDMKAFVDKLNAEKGPFVFVNQQTPDDQKFVAWLMLVDPSFVDWAMQYGLLKMGFGVDPTLKIPEWVKGDDLRLSKEMYDKYLSCTARVKRMIAKQGAFMATSRPEAEIMKFTDWWRIYDTPGAAALMILYADPAAPPGAMPNLQLPKQLFNFWQTTGGKSAPSRELLGFEEPSILDWVFDNWLWIAGGVVGGAVVAGWYVNRSRGMSRNPLLENMQEGWGQTVELKSGTYHLHPILPETYVRSMKAMNMRNAKKFRVSAEGKSLGELHRSSGKRNWRARSYFGVEKYGDSRAALLAWLKDEAPVEGLAQREAELLEGVHIPMPMTNNLTREVL